MKLYELFFLCTFSFVLRNNLHCAGRLVYCKSCYVNQAQELPLQPKVLAQPPYRIVDSHFGNLFISAFYRTPWHTGGKQYVIMKTRTFLTRLYSIVALGVLLTVAHAIYAVYTYGSSSIIHFVSKELW